MRFAVISDIHSNYMALENALCIIDDMRRSQKAVNGIIFLGDYLTDFPYPQNTLRLIDECKAEFPCYFVRGNREDYLIKHKYAVDDGWSYCSGSGSLLYTYEHLAKCDIEMFEQMPVSLNIECKGLPTITACHGSPSNTKEWIMNRPALIDKYTADLPGSILLCGHTHRGGFAEANGKKVIFCPSVGLPQDKHHGSRMLMLESNGDRWYHRSLSVGYDKQKMLSEFHNSGLYDKAMVWARCIIRSMFDERDHASRCVALAWKKAAEDGLGDIGLLPEEYWVAAAKELELI